MVRTATEVVAQVAYASSDVIVDAGICRNEFARILKAQTHGRKPRLVTVQSNADIGAYLEHCASPASSPSGSIPPLVALTARSSTCTLGQLLPYLATFAQRQIVLQLGVSRGVGLTEAIHLRSAAQYILYSSTASRAKANALIASRLASKGLVVHIFEMDGEEMDGGFDLTDEQIREYVQVASGRATNGHANNAQVRDGKHNDVANTNGHANGNGKQNGHANGIANGHGSGAQNGDSSSSSGYSSPTSEAKSPLDDPASLIFYEAYEEALLEAVSMTQQNIQPFYVRGPSDAHNVFLVLGQTPTISVDDVVFIEVALVSPVVPSKLLREIPPSGSRIFVLEQLYDWSLKWTPLCLDVMAALQKGEAGHPLPVQSVILGEPPSIFKTDLLKLIQHDVSQSRLQRLQVGKPAARAGLVEENGEILQVPKHESSYTKILSQIFGGRLEIANAPELVKSHGPVATTPEFALGRVQTQIDARARLVEAIQSLLEAHPPALSSDLHALFSKWLVSSDVPDQNQLYTLEILKALENSDATKNPAINAFLSLRPHLISSSRWIIGSDAWAYDLGASGLHHLIASGKNVNMLILDTVPYSRRRENGSDSLRRKRDIGLYAMNHGDVYVASVAVYSSYTQVLQALVEADRFQGPSVVLAHLPYVDETSSALEVLKETKLAIDSGYWPLYRWDPSKEKVGKEPFTLDSDAIKQELRDFLDRENHLSQLTQPSPVFATELIGSLGERVREARQKRARQAYSDLLNNITGAPLLVLYASDGGSAEKKAKRLAARGKARGLSTRVAPMDSVTIEELAQEENVAFVTSVAGQGEPPQNGRALFKSLNATAATLSSPEDNPFISVKYTVFGMGDSHYWPRPEDAHFYNKPGKDLDARLASLGATRFADLGLGDDQDADGPETGYKLWEPLVWRALGVDTVEVTEAEAEPITNEHMKAASNYLRGTIVEGLEDSTTGALAPSDTQLTKFHGIYQQDDRDIRDERLAEGVEPAYAFMIRVRLPGGVCTPEQWLAMDRVADEHGNGTFKITTRQTYQFHGVIKRHLKQTIKDINRVLLDTLAACGDVNRNVVTSAISTKSTLHADVHEFARTLSEKLLPHTTAYHEIWLDKKLVAGDAVHDFEPLYGEFYLPRKFKVAVAVPPTNDVDVFANDVGFIAIVGKDGRLEGFNVAAGGGMGVTHGNKKTYPRLGSILGFCTPEQGHSVAEKIMLVQRDNGNRADRKNARLKYTIDRMGLNVFKTEVEKLLGWKLEPAKPYAFDRNIDDFGWSVGENDKHNFMMYIENGRVQDEPGQNFKTGLREIARIHKGTFRLTTNQHLLLADVPSEELPRVKSLLAEYRLDNLDYTGLRLSSSACVAFPTCGLAMAESERYLPVLISKVEAICEEYGLRNDTIVMRMTGCPNGCARPYVAEIAFVGKAPGTYLMLLGGGYYGQRLNKIYRESVTEPEILAILRPMIAHYAKERLEGEHFGDFVIRTGYISATTEGKEWYEGMGGLGVHREISVAT